MAIDTLGAGTVARSAGARAQASPPAAAGPGVLKDLRTVALLFLTLRGALFGVVYVGRALAEELHPSESVTGFGPFTDGWVRFDAGWFMSVAKDGYRPPADGRWTTQANVAFFPLFPWAVRAASKVVGGRNHWFAGLFIANASTLFALFFLLRIARRSMGEEAARRALAYLLLYPSSFFLSAYYSEGLFLLTTAASFHYFLGRRYLLCGVWGYLAALTRSPGVLLLPAFALGLALERRGRLARDDLPALWLLLIPCGLLTFMAVLQVEVGDPLAFLRIQAAWGRGAASPLRTLAEGALAADWGLPLYGRNLVHVLDVATAALFLALPFLLPRGCDRSLAIYALLVVLMPLCSGRSYSMLRFELAAFPSFLALARLGERRDVDRAIVAGSALLLGVLSLGFANGQWIG